MCNTGFSKAGKKRHTTKLMQTNCLWRMQSNNGLFHYFAIMCCTSNH